MNKICGALALLVAVLIANLAGHTYRMHDNPRAVVALVFAAGLCACSAIYMLWESDDA